MVNNIVTVNGTDITSTQMGGNAITMVMSDDFEPGALTGDIIVTNPNYNSRPGYIIAHSPYCPHCVKKEPLYKQVADYLTPLGITIGKLDCANGKNKKACELLGINGVPSVYTVSSRGQISEYKGRQDYGSFVDHACKEFGICAAMGGGKKKSKRSKSKSSRKRRRRRSAKKSKRSKSKSSSKRRRRRSSSSKKKA